MSINRFLDCKLRTSKWIPEKLDIELVSKISYPAHNLRNLSCILFTKPKTLRAGLNHYYLDSVLYSNIYRKCHKN